MRLILLLALIVAMPAMAREPDYNYAGVHYEHGDDLAITWAEAGMEFGENWHASAFMALNATETKVHDESAYGVGIGHHWTVTTNGDVFLDVRAMHLKYTFHIPVEMALIDEPSVFSVIDHTTSGWIYTPVIGYTSGLGDHLVATIEAGWNINRLDHTSTDHYWDYTARLEAFPFDNELAITATLHYDEYNHEFRPGVGVFWHW